MAKFSTTFLKFLLRLIAQALFPGRSPESQSLSQATTLLSKASSLIDAGDLLYFHYNDRERLLFVVSARRGSGVYNTPQNNKVISGFVVNEVTPELIVTVLSGLYKNAERLGFPVRMLFTYKVVKGLKRVFHESNFRTFMTNRIDGNINQLELNIAKNVEEEE